MIDEFIYVAKVLFYRSFLALLFWLGVSQLVAHNLDAAKYTQTKISNHAVL